jgi:ABC-2 type transport system permease protein
MISLRRTAAITRKEFRQLRRDRLSLGMMVGVPLLQLMLFGYAINTDVRHLRAGVADFAGTERSRRLIADAAASQVVDPVARARSAGELESLMRRGTISVGLLVPRDFDRRVAHRDRVPAQLFVDGSDPTVLGVARALTGLPIEHRVALSPTAPVARRAPGSFAASLSVAPPPPTFEVRAYYNPERRSAVQIVPGLIGTILTMTMVLFTAVALVRERERGTFELLITTPVRRAELMIGKIVPYIAIGLVQTTLILTTGVLLFGVPVRGSLLDLYLAAAVFIGASLTLGLIISTIAQTQFQAMQLMVFVFLPSILLSGFMFPFDGMPRAARLIGELLPLTHFMRLVRGIVLRGATIAEVQADVWPLVVFSVVMLGLAIQRFRKRLD